MHYLYIIHSTTIDKYYVGETINLDNRIYQHNTHHFKTNYTKAATDWKIVLSKTCSSYEEAKYLEKFIKRMKSRKFIEKILTAPEILDDLIRKR